MRENRTYGSEGGGTEFNRSFLPLSKATVCGQVFSAAATSNVLEDPKSKTPFAVNAQVSEPLLFIRPS